MTDTEEKYLEVARAFLRAILENWNQTINQAFFNTGYLPEELETARITL